MDIARCAWKELERLTGTEGSPGAPMSLRDAVRQERGFEPAGPGVGDAAYRTIQWIPRGLAVVGSALVGWGAVRLMRPIPVTGP